MCGICAVVDGSGPARRDLVEAMCNRMVHRGPDGSGIHAHGPAALGMRRLSIIDLEGGDQPIYNEDRSVGVVYNGEIYNYRQLREELIERGHHFATRSDTEVLVHLYEDFGLDTPKYLDGMFAFALHDMVKDEVVIARDRLGIKPLHYAVVDDKLFVASEIKCLLEVPEISRELDPIAIEQYFSLLYVPAPRTVFASIRKLPPGHLLIKAPGAEPVVRRYWSLDVSPAPERSEREWIDGFRRRFDDAVASHMVADVPVGVFLSGGLDSGGLVAALAGKGFAGVKTFTIGFGAEYAAFDERDMARRVASRYGTDHHELEVEPNVVETVERIGRVFDEPMGDSGAIPNFIVCELARQHLPVVLTGLGGDELAGGYERYLGVKLAEWYRRLPGGLRRALIEPAVAAIPEPRRGGRGVDRAKRFVRHGALPWLPRYLSFCLALDDRERADLFAPELRAQVDGDAALRLFSEHAEGTGDADLVNRMLAIDMATYMVDDLLVVADRVSMAVSLEARVPFLDHRLVEFTAGIPGSLKVRGLRKKHLLRRAFANDLPAEIVRGKKSGFSLPISRWLREELSDVLDDYLEEGRIERQGLFNPQTIRRLRADHDARRTNYSSALWAMLMFQVWWNGFVEP